MKTYIKLEPPYEWVRVDGRKVESFGEVPSLDQYPLSDDYQTVGVVPGEWVTVHQVNIPAKSKKQFQAALPYALEEAVSEDVENLHFVCPQWKSGQECVVLVVAKEKMRYWQTLANENRLPVDQLVPDHALIPFHDAADCSIALTDGHILANHQNGFGVSIDPDFLDVWMMDMPLASTIAVNDKQLTEELIEEHPDRDFRHWPFGNKMAHWLEHFQQANYDLWADKFRPSVTKFNWRTFVLPLCLIGVAIVAKFGFDTYRYLSLHAEIRSISAEMKEIVSTTFPKIEYVEPERERFMMEQAIARMGGADQTRSAQSMLAETAGVLRRERVTIANMVYRDFTLEITCQLNDFSQVDKLTRQLNARPRISATLQSSAADDGEIIASYTIKHT